MATNPYFNNYKATNEQDLLEGMVIESIQMKGLDCVYIKRVQDNMDYLFNEDPSSYFVEENIIEMYPASVDGFEGDISFGRFEMEFNQSATFLVSKKRFTEMFPDFLRPFEGDIIFMPITNAFLEIKYVNAESPFFQKGRQYVWEIKVEMYRYSHEDFTVTDPEAQAALDIMELERFLEPDYEDFVTSTPDPVSDNSVLESDGQDYIVVDPSNPFGVR